MSKAVFGVVLVLAALLMLPKPGVSSFAAERAPISPTPTGEREQPLGLTETPEPTISTPTNTVTPLPTETPTPVTEATPTPTRKPPPDRDRKDTPTPTPTPTTATGIEVNQTADVTVRKRVAPTSAQVGDEILYTIDVENLGPGIARNVLAGDTVPDQLEIVDVSVSGGNVVRDGQRITVQIESLAPGETRSITVRARVRPEALGTIVNNAVVQGDGNVNLENDIAQVPLEVGQVVAPPALPVTGEPPGNGPWALLTALLLIALGGLVLLVQHRRRLP